MYVPPHFREERVEVLHDLIRAHSLATLVTLGADGLTASHIPMLIDPEPAPYGTLKGHFARANPHWQDISSEVEALAVFSGPQAYVTPSWYPTKQETGRVVPTWNYAVVHAYGRIETYTDPDRLLALITSLTDHYERELAAPWAVSDAPDDFVQRQLRAIVGIEIPVARLEGKWKVSQNRNAADRAGVAKGLSASADAEDRSVAALVSDVD
ncbi:MAG: FMN-binding negative transcriptional regulator [Hyphomicrobiales bacterium]|nr:FMN-binding negative transcriptional regulator [Hyphomicrobiales bacterium]